MSKHEPIPPLGDASEICLPRASRRLRIGRSPPVARAKSALSALVTWGRRWPQTSPPSGRQVVAYVRRPDQIGKLEALGLRPTTDIGDLLDCEVVISMLPDDDAVREIVFGRKDIGLDGLAAGLMPGAIHLSMSTISTAAASLLASEHARNGQGYVAAPVFGNPDAARARQLFIVAAGAPADVERCQPILDNLGQRTFVIGADPARRKPRQVARQHDERDGAGDARRSRCPVPQARAGPAAFHRHHDKHDVRRPRALRSMATRSRSRPMRPDSSCPSCSRMCAWRLRRRKKRQAPMPSVSVVRDRLITGIARGYAELDWTALGLIAAEEAGLLGARRPDE